MFLSELAFAGWTGEALGLAMLFSPLINGGDKGIRWIGI